MKDHRPRKINILIRAAQLMKRKHCVPAHKQCEDRCSLYVLSSLQENNKTALYLQKSSINNGLDENTKSLKFTTDHIKFLKCNSARNSNQTYPFYRGIIESKLSVCANERLVIESQDKCALS